MGCDRFPEGHRLRAICEGKANLPPETINAYRKKWGLPPLSADQVEYTRPPKGTPRLPGTRPKTAEGSKRCGSCGGKRKADLHRREPITRRGPGTALLQAFESAGVPHCQDCLDLAEKMNEWGVDGCRHRLDSIVEDILPRATEWLKDNRQVVETLLSVTGTKTTALRWAIRRKVSKAIKEAQAHAAKGLFPSGRHWASSFRNPTTGLPEYITTARLMQDTLSLIRKLPPDITMVAGGARSGLCPATLAAMMLHLPLVVIRNRQGDWVSGGHGWRLNEGKPTRNGKVLVLDDTTMTGNSLLRTKHVIQDLPGEKIFASVYVNPKAVNKPDIWEADLPWPHLLEWNLFNSVLLDSFAVDFDGILCHDCPVADDDDGERYLNFLANVRPLYLIRKKPISLIVTARLEKYRPQTLAWMEKWGIQANRLVMGPWRTKQERSRADVAEFKAQEIQSFVTRRHGINPKMFIESDPRQAERIAKLTGNLVVCPPARRCFR